MGWTQQALVNLPQLKELVIVRMRADPEPDNVLALIQRESSVMRADSYRPQSINLLEMQGWVMRIRFE